MVNSKASNVSEYLKELTPEQRSVVSTVRDLILRHIPTGYQEMMSLGWGTISYVIPLAAYPKTYNGKPLVYAALAAQKNYYSLYLMALYQNPILETVLKEAFSKAGKKLDMGKSCVRFRKLDGLPLDDIGKIIASVTPAQFIARYEQAQRR